MWLCLCLAVWGVSGLGLNLCHAECGARAEQDKPGLYPASATPSSESSQAANAQRWVKGRKCTLVSQVRVGAKGLLNQARLPCLDFPLA